MRKFTTLATATLITVMSLLGSACTPEQIAASRSAGISISATQEQVLLALPNRYIHPDPNVEQWYDTAIAAGWPTDSWQWVSCIISRESDGKPGTWNRYDAAGGSRGLMQINGSWGGFLRSVGALTYITDLFDPLTNLQAALAIYNVEGAKPWVSRQPC